MRVFVLARRFTLCKALKPTACVGLMNGPQFRATAIAEHGKDGRAGTNKVSDTLAPWVEFVDSRTYG